jgi:hypothetical protein
MTRRGKQFDFEYGDKVWLVVLLAGFAIVSAALWLAQGGP